MRWAIRILACLPMLGLGCGGAGGSASPDGGVGGCTIPQCSYGALELWQEPIADYIEGASQSLNSAKLARGIHDLMVFDDRLYFAYGDATLNSGRVFPTEVRYFATPDDVAVSKEDVVTLEEQIDHYRSFGAMLYFPGVDSAEDEFLGNVFSKPAGGVFTRHRSVTAGVHIHDMAEFQGGLYACGSGALDAESFYTHVHSYLWRSQDGGETFDMPGDIEATEAGDRRWTNLLPLGDELLLFGYAANAQGRINVLLQNAWDGSQLTDRPSAPGVFVTRTELLSPSKGIIVGIKADQQPLVPQTLVIEAGGTAAAVGEPLASMSVSDISVFASGRALVLAYGDATYPPPKLPAAPFHIFYTEDFATFTELLTVEFATWPESIAYWQGGLYVGLSDGQILRALPLPPAT